MAARLHTAPDEADRNTVRASELLHGNRRHRGRAVSPSSIAATKAGRDGATFRHTQIRSPGASTRHSPPTQK